MKRLLVLIMALALSLGMLTCAAETEAPLEFTLMMAYWVDQPPQTENNYLFDKFQEMLNIKLNLVLYPSANYTDKVMLALSSGDLPDVMWVSDAMVKTKAVIDAAEAGAFWDCTDLLNNDDYPNLKKTITSTMIANASINGRVYGMPGPRPSARNGMFYRSDLFEKYDIPVPHDIDSFYEAAKLIKEYEPDMIPYSYQGMIINFLTCSQGGFNNWGERDGELAPAYDTYEYKNTLKVLRDMYAEGLMNQDFAIVTGSEERADLVAGKSAMYSATYDNYDILQSSLWQVDPDANLGIIPVFNGTTNAQVGSALYTISSQVSKEKRDAIFRYFENSLEQDILTWEYYGEEGRNYTLVDGIPVFIDEAAALEANTTLFVYKSCAVNPVAIFWPGDSDIVKAWKQATVDYAESCIRDYSSPLVSQTQTEKGAELDKIISDARTQYIMGVIDEAGYDEAVQRWYDQGGYQIAEEFTAEYEKSLQ